jgi:ribosome-associated protein
LRSKKQAFLLRERFGTSPGGLNVNKVATVVQLRLDVINSHGLPFEIKQRLVKVARHRMTERGILTIEARRYRTQEQNKKDAQIRFEKLLEKAMIQDKPRLPTRPTRSSQVHRVESKKLHGKTKSLRKTVKNED